MMRAKIKYLRALAIAVNIQICETLLTFAVNSYHETRSGPSPIDYKPQACF
jgi:hypothetical protein